MSSLVSAFVRFENTIVVRSLRDGLMAMLPAFVVGSAALIAFQLPWKPAATAVSASGAVPFLAHLYTSVFQIGGPMTAACIAVAWARNAKLVPMPAAVIAFAAFLVLVPDSISLDIYDGQASDITSVFGLVDTTSSVSGLSKTWFSDSGVFMGIVAGMLTGCVYVGMSRLLRARRGQVGAEAAGAASVYAIPSAFAVIGICGIAHVVSTVGWGVSPAELVYRLNPFNGLLLFGGTDSLAQALWYPLTLSLAWFFGLHGEQVVSNYLEWSRFVALAENANLVAEGLRPEHVFTDTFYSNFVAVSGAGITIGLAICLALLARTRSLRILGIVSVVLALFNISEPLLYCLIILNPVMLIPFVLVPMVSMAVGWLGTTMGFIAYTTELFAWTMPIVVVGFLSSGPGGGLAQLLVVVLSSLIYLPFALLQDHVSWVVEHGSEEGYSPRFSLSAPRSVQAPQPAPATWTGAQQASPWQEKTRPPAQAWQPQWNQQQEHARQWTQRVSDAVPQQDAGQHFPAEEDRLPDGAPGQNRYDPYTGKRLW